MYSTGYSCQILMQLEFSRQNFEKYSNVKFNEYPSILGAEFCADRQPDGWAETDRQT